VDQLSSTIVNFKIPFNVWSNNLVDYLDLKAIGSPTYYYVYKGKLESREKSGCLWAT